MYLRNQDILNKHMILKSVGCNMFIEDNNAFFINLPNEEDLIKIERTYDDIIYVNTIEDHILYINKKPFVLRSKENSNKLPQHFCNMSKSNIELNEEKLCIEAENEAKQNGCVKVMNNNENRYIKKQEITIETSLNFFRKKKYHRITFPFYSFGVDNTFIDIVLDLVKKNANKQVIFLFNDDISAAIMIKSMLRVCANFDKNKTYTLNDRSNKDYEYRRYKDNLVHVNHIKDNQIPLIDLAIEGKYKVVMNLIHILQHNKTKKYLDASFDVNCDLKLLLIEQILKNKNKCEYANLLLSRYLILLIITDYIICQKADIKNNKFIDYISENYEYSNLCRFLRNKKSCEALISPLHRLFCNTNDSNLILDTAILVRMSNKNIEKQEHVKNYKIKEKITNNINLNGKNTIKLKSLHIVNYINIKNDKNAVFINLREEPHIFIKNQLYILRDYEQYNKNITYLRFVSKSKLKEIENKMKECLITELKNTNQIKYYMFENGDLIESCIKNIGGTDIYTINEYFTKFCDNVHYIRRPVTSSVPFSFDMFDKIIKMIKKHELFAINKQIHLFSQTRYGRAAYIAIIFEIIANTSENINNYSIPPYQVFLLLTKLLPDGNKAHAIVAHLFYKYFRSNLVQYVSNEKMLKNIIRSLKKYFLLVCFASYILECSKQSDMSCEENKTQKTDTNKNHAVFEDLRYDNCSFKAWMIKQKAVLHQYNEISKICLDDLYIKEEEYDKNLFERNGKILKSMMILKNDNFIGSEVFTEYKKLSGVRNLRIHKLNETMIIGLSMPTKKGVDNIIKMLHKKDAIMWFCLREEPIVYINGSPYVLRNYNTPNINIEITGVTTEKVEEIENMLKQDVAQSTQIYLHDEIKMQQKIKTIAKNVEIVELMTPKEIYSKHKIEYHRVPITDEQIPLPHVIDSIYRKIVDSPSAKTLIFNCQIGRGRTTTGMVITYLITDRHKKVYYDIKYKAVSYLMQILPNGSMSKQITDYAIDQLEHVQNLRKMIEKHENNSDEKSYNFLKRYMYLICFTEFLLQKNEETFVHFLTKRKEIQNLIDLVDKIGFKHA